jgi:hypothetical protein
VEGGSAGSDGGAGDAGVDACETLEALRVASDEAEEVVASRMYSTTSHVCKVASGAKDTRRLARYLSAVHPDCSYARNTYPATCGGLRAVSSRLHRSRLEWT